MSDKKGYIPKDERKKILFLADDMRVTSGVGTMAREIIEGTAHRFNWVQVGAAVSHPEAGKVLDVSDGVNQEPIYGKDIRSEKYLYILSRYISHNLFEKNLCKTLDIHISTNAELSNISWENINLTIDSESLITTKKWVESLVLDIFDFEPEKLISHLGLENYDSANEILVLNENYPWKNRDRVKEIILL